MAGLGSQLGRLARHSAIYGLGGIVSRVLAVLLLPLYSNPRYLSAADFGRVEVLTAFSAVLVTLLRLGISSAFFRFYFDSPDLARRTLIVRTSFWFTMAMATLGLVVGVALAEPLSQVLLGGSHRSLVVATFVAIWAQMNYEQRTALFRVEERSVAFVLASLANIFVTVGATILLVVVVHKHALGLLVGNLTGTLAIYLVLLAYRRYQLGLEFSRDLLREMNRFGMPLVPSALALWTLNFSDRFFLRAFSGAAEVGKYSIGVKVASVMTLLLVAFRTAWPAFAYSIEDDREARRTYGFVLTYLIYATCWASLALGLLSPWLVADVLAPKNPALWAGSRVVAPLAFAGAAWAAYTVVAIGIGRARRTQFNWVVTGAAAAVNVGLNVALIPSYGMMGAAAATVAAYSVMFLGMTWHAQRIYPVPYQWRRLATLVATAIGLLVVGKALDVPLGVAIALAAVYPLVLLALGFYLPAERTRLLRLPRL